MDEDAAARPRFKSSVETVVDADHGLFVLAEGSQAWLDDPVCAALAPLLDGRHCVESIFDALAQGFEGERILAALDRLDALGLLAQDTCDAPRPERAFWEHAGVGPALARSRLAQTTVAVLSLGTTPSDLLADLLRRQGLAVAPPGSPVVVLADDYLDPALEHWNAQALASSRPWLLAKPTGVQTWLGPAFVPGQTACWMCLAQRLRGHRRLEQWLGRRRDGQAPPRPPGVALASTTLACLGELATELTRWIGAGGASVLAERVCTTDVLSLQRREHRLVRRPQCPACGSAAAADARRERPLLLQPRRKLPGGDGAHRARAAAEVAAELERHLSPVTGIVSALEPGQRCGAAGLTGFAPTYAADHNFADMHDERFFLQEGLRRRSGGKGQSAAQARASALGESIERYCGVFDGTEPRLRATQAELGPAALPPNACMGYSERQYAWREQHNRKRHKAHWVPQPFRADQAIEWTPLWSLTHACTRYLPTSMCYFGYRSADPCFARADSNGCAAGSVLEEAVLQGLLELVERDAVALWWYNRLPRPGVALEGVDDAYVQGLLAHYRDLRREVWALDLTSDLGIPSFAALSRRVDKAEEDIIYGFGAHLDPLLALTRALSELNQSLEAVPMASGPTSAQTYRGSDEALAWWRTVRKHDTPWLAPDPGAAPRLPADFADLASDDLQRDIELCRDLARARGIDILVLDQTRPDVGLPVVRVVAPGLRHFWARYGPGRLYDVPVSQGWLERPRQESELNPFVIQF